MTRLYLIFLGANDLRVEVFLSLRLRVNLFVVLLNINDVIDLILFVSNYGNAVFLDFTTAALL